MTRVAAASTDLIAGIGAGLVAAWAMNLFQNGWMKLADEPEPEETAASRAADTLSEEATGAPIKKGGKRAADCVLHYATAAVIGGFYGLVGGQFPRIFAANGLLFGAGVWLVADELVVPALQLAPPPAETELKDHALGLGSHLIFGAVLDLVRRRINAVISPGSSIREGHHL
jgi:hypothetical protein